MPDPLHSHYDEVGVVFDGKFHSADGLPDITTAAPTKRTRMSSSPFNLNLSRLTRDEFLLMVNPATSTLAPEPLPLPAVAPVPPMLVGNQATVQTSFDGTTVRFTFGMP